MIRHRRRRARQASPPPAGTDPLHDGGLPSDPGSHTQRRRRATVRRRPPGTHRRAARATASLAALVTVAGMGVAAFGSPWRAHPRAVRASRQPAGAQAGPSPVATSPPGPAVAQGPGSVVAPAPGVYRYRSTFSDPARRPVELAERISVQAATAGRTTERIFATSGVDATVVFTSAGETEVSYRQVGTEITDGVTCDDNPPRTLLALPLAVDRTWSSVTLCTNLLHDRFREERQFRVTGHATQPVGPAQIPVWEIAVVETRTAIAQGGPPQRTTITEDVSRDGLAVRVVTQVGTDPSMVRTDRLISVTPA